MKMKDKVTGDDFKKLIFETLKKETTQEELRVLVKLCLDSSKRITYSQLLEMDEVYKNQEKAYRQALNAYEAIKLTAEQKDAVQNLIAKTDELAFEANLMAYEAGLLDAYRVLKLLGVTNE